MTPYFSLEYITTNVERRNGMMLDSAIAKQFAVRMGSTNHVKIEKTSTILLPILLNILNTPALSHDQDSKKGRNQLLKV